MQSLASRQSISEDKIQARSESEHYLTEINLKIDELYKKLEPVFVSFPQVENQKESQTSELIMALRKVNDRLATLVSGIII